jgi:hypothetical protein
MRLVDSQDVMIMRYGPSDLEVSSSRRGRLIRSFDDEGLLTMWLLSLRVVDDKGSKTTWESKSQ